LWHTETVVSYPAGYSHRIAVNDRRILVIDNDQALWRYR